MEAQSSKPQSNRYSLTWGEVYARLSKLPTTGRCFGVPRGGAVVAGLTGRAVTNVIDADFIVDDIYDSGRTSDKLAKLHPDKPIYYLIDKRHEFQHVWVEFPWEHTQNDMEDTVARQLQYLGQDVNREGLISTPSRVVKSWATLYGGYQMDPAKILETRFTQDNYDQIVLLKDIEMYSTCEHHMLPFYGRAHVAYIPDKFVVGLSKLARLVECFARRFQIQEQLTNQIVDAIEQHLKPKGSMCVIEAKHMCMVSRGIQKQNSVMVTSAIRGAFQEPGTKKELMDLIK